MHINPLFNATYYQAVHLDLILAGLSSTEQLWQHYVQYGAAEDRKPNRWFDADYYLQNNPDLVQAGLSGSQALQHFYDYGLYESVRNNTFSRSVKNSDFSAVDYAEAAANADLLTAFAIGDPQQLTPLQQAQLFGHYLSWGYAEGREGAGPIAQHLKAAHVLHQETTGTLADDEIHWSLAYMNSASLRFIDGLGGFDTLVLGPRVTTGINEEGIVLNSIERLVIDGTTKLTNSKPEAHFQALTALQQLSFSATGAGAGTDLTVKLWVDSGAVAGTDDLLQVEVHNAGQQQGVSLITNGYEQLHVQLGEDVSQVGTLQMDQTQGTSFSVQLQGGSSTGLNIGTINNQGSSTVQQLIIDAAGLGGALQVGQWGQLNNVWQIKVIGAQAWQKGVEALGLELTAQHDVHWVGGAEADVLVVSAAIDRLQGGAGSDVFDLSGTGVSTVRVQPNGDAFEISAMDTIIDFKKGDGLRLDSLEWLAPRTGQHATLQTLEDAVTQVQKAGQAFNFNGDGYVVLQLAQATDGSDLELIKLSGVDMSRFFDAQGQAHWDVDLQAFTWVS